MIRQITRSVFRYSCVLAGCLLLSVSRARAAYSDNFDALETELHNRSAALSNSTDKTDIKIKKSLDKIIATIDKPATSLATDLKTATTIVKSLSKIYPSEFPTAHVKMNVVQVTLYGLITNVFENIQSDASDSLSNVTVQVNALPDGANKTKALAALSDARDALTQAEGTTDFSAFAKALTAMLKDLGGAVKAAESPSTVHVNGKGLICKVNGTSFSALGALGIYINSTGEFSVTGATVVRAVTIMAEGVHGPGTYPAIGGSGVTELTSGTSYQGSVTGSITIVTLDLPNKKTTGTFHFTAAQTQPASSNTVAVTEGSFNISGLTAF